MIFILEDNSYRVRQFRTTAKLLVPEPDLRVWHIAHTMIADLLECLQDASLISLDHDLIERANEGDSGTGYDVAKLLGELIPCCPIILHTSNSERGRWMHGELTRAGWRIEIVHPGESEWIARSWKAAAQRLTSQT